MRVISVRSASLKRWDAKHFLEETWGEGATCMMPLGDFLDRRVEPLPDGRRETVPVGSIHFDGTMSIRSQPASSLKGRLFIAKAGDLVYSKIDARNGACALVPAEISEIAFTSEFPIYTVRPAEAGQVLLPRIAWMLVRTPVFKSKIEARVSGHSGRKRIAPAAFEETLVPIYDLEVQEIILQDWDETNAVADGLETQATEQEQNLPQVIRTQLGIFESSPAATESIRIGRSSNLRLWDAISNCADPPELTSNLSGSEVRPLSDCVATWFSGGTPSTRNAAYWDGSILWASPKDVKSFEISDTIDQITPEGLAQIRNAIVPAGTVLIVVRSMILARKLPVAVAVRELAINQDLKGLLPKADTNPWYLAEYLLATQDFLLARVKRDSRRALRSEHLDDYPVVWIEPSQQNELVELARTERESITRKVREATAIRLSALETALSRLEGRTPANLSDADTELGGQGKLDAA